MRPSKLVSNIGSVLFGNLAYAASQWTIALLIARWFGPTALGQFFLAQAVCIPAFSFANMQLQFVQATDAGKRYRFREYLMLQTVLLGSCLTLLLAAGWLLLQERDSFSVFSLVAIGRFLYFASTPLLGFVQKHDRMHHLAVMVGAKGIAGLAGFLIGAAMTGSMGGGLFGAGLGLATAVLFVDAPLVVITAHQAGTALTPRIRIPVVRSLAKDVLPLGVSSFLATVGPSVPMYFLAAAVPLDQVGYAGALLHFAQPVFRVANAMKQVLAPKIAEAMHGSVSTTVRTIANRLLPLAIGTSVAAGAMAFTLGDSMLTLFYGQGFTGHAAVLCGVVVWAIWDSAYYFIEAALMARSSFRQVLAARVLDIAGTAIACWLLMPMVGLAAIPVALILGTIAKTTTALLELPSRTASR